MSSKSMVKCFLRSLSSSHPDIPLLHKVEVIIGRSPQTKIKDPRLTSDEVILITVKNFADAAENN